MLYLVNVHITENGIQEKYLSTLLVLVNYISLSRDKNCYVLPLERED
jgi:archaellum component FlaF (FlaF/FlaG flagellin family)